MKKRERGRKKIEGGQEVVVKVGDDHIAAADPEGEDPDLGQGNELNYTSKFLFYMYLPYLPGTVKSDI